MTAAAELREERTLFGHPTGLFTLFFAEMWERFSYYGMRALLVFYMIKGFLKYQDTQAYAVYGAYTALVYATPFIGGMLADRLLGARKAVVLGGLLMAAGHLTMSFENKPAFFTALALLVVGNGFFKPNISTIVGTLYRDGSPKRDGGFTIFYMGINLGAAMAPLLCGYIGETYGWHYGFGLATIGMLIGVAVFVAPTVVTQLLILGGAIPSAVVMVSQPNDPWTFGVVSFVALALVVAALISVVALSRGGLPEWAGAPKNPEFLRRKYFGLRAEYWVYIGSLLAVPLIALVVGRNEIAGWCLFIFGGLAFLSLVMRATTSQKIERERMFVVLVLLFFSMLFWAFFEQAGSSMNNFADRNVDRVREEQVVTEADIGSTLTLTLSQEQLGHRNGEQLITMDVLTEARASGNVEVQWQVDEDDVGMGIEGAEVPASVFQAANPIFILVFGLAFTALWGFLGTRGWEPSTPFKFSLGLLQLGLGFGALWYGAVLANGRGMVGVQWLLLGYMLHTTGELCLSPVGLSMITKLSPSKIVSTVMGAWFLATAFSNYLAGLIATFTGVGHGGDGETISIPPPIETVGIYGDVFGKIALTAIISALICFILSPILTKWMHEGEVGESEDPATADPRERRFDDAPAPVSARQADAT
ncbi:MAG: peptide MFS transporter [Myxococcota bacterium]